MGASVKGYLIVGLIAVAAAVRYMIHCALWPLAACRRCKGGGRFHAPNGRAWRTCRKCGGTGGRIRIGRRIWNWSRNRS